MRVFRIAMLALLVGVVAGTVYCQPAPYGGSPDPYDQEGANWRHPDNDYDYGHGPDQDVGFFYNELSPYGEWVRHPYYGWVWFPRHVRAGWRPYSLGRWVESDWGWTWVSAEPFGWATYHYGRWTWDPYVGWLWVPGTDWGPAWVSWQHGNGYIGWAPLPPQVGYEVGIGLRFGGFNISVGIAARDYSFVEERRFLRSRIDSYIVPQARNATMIRNTTNVTNYAVVNNRVINRGVPVERIEQATGTRAPVLRVAPARQPSGGGVQRDTVTIYRPEATKLETVTIARRNNAGLPKMVAPPPRTETQPPITRQAPGSVPVHPVTAPLPIPVAPRVKPVSQPSNESQFLREQKDLKAAQDKEQRALDQIHRQELAQAQARKLDAQEVAQRHAAELQAQQELRQRSAQQLQVRQQLERQAAQASAANSQKVPPPANPGQAKKEQKDSSKDDNKKDKNPPR